MHGCLTGIAGLQAAEAVQLGPNQTAMLVKALLEVQITSLPQADRMMALTILHRALQVIQHRWLRNISWLLDQRRTRHNHVHGALLNPDCIPAKQVRA